MLDTEYYNGRLFDLHLRSEFSSAIASLVEATDTANSILISYAAQEAAASGSPLSLEALGDYVARGAGKASTLLINVYKAIYNMGIWMLGLLKKMIVFAIKGFPGTIGGAILSAKKIGGRVVHMQNVKVKTALSPAIADRVSKILEDHSKYVSVQLNGGEIAKAKSAYISAFNASMSHDAQIDAGFVCVNAPSNLGTVTLKDCKCNSSDDLVEIGETLTEAGETLKTRLGELKKEGDTVRSVIKTMKAKGFNKTSTNNAESTKVLAASYHAAVLANDMKYLHIMQGFYIGMIHSLKKKAKEYVE